MMFLGLDIGTQGVRCMVVDEHGRECARSSVPFADINTADTGRYPTRKEQRPQDWWAAAKRALQQATRMLREGGYACEDIVSMAVDGTSGTVLALNAQGEPLTSGILYNDARADGEAATVQQAGEDTAARLGYKFGSSYALPRLLWWKTHRPRVFERAAHFSHQADFLVYKLCGAANISDFSNALKTGYDFVDECWPAFIPQKLGIPLSKLPRVIAPGTPIAPISAQAAAQTGLSTRTMLVAGATDGYASAVASGAVSPGEFASVIGTTLVLKGVSRKLICDPQGRVYCHKHPQGYYMPGGAGNVGGLCLREHFDEAQLDALNARVLSLAPTGLVAYPLTGTGERFPFVSKDAKGFMLGAPGSREQHYTALLEGVGFVERLAYDVLRDLGAEVGDTIMISGGATKSAPWSQLRADILGKTLVQSATEAAMGSAMLAAMHVMGTLQDVAKAMIRPVSRFTPDMDRHRRYNELYHRFVGELRSRGYMQ